MCDGWPAGPAPCRFYSTPIGIATRRGLRRPDDEPDRPQCGQPFVSIPGETIFDRDVLALDRACVFHAGMLTKQVVALATSLGSDRSAHYHRPQESATPLWKLVNPYTPRVSLAARPEKREYLRQFGSHPGNPGLMLRRSSAAVATSLAGHRPPRSAVNHHKGGHWPNVRSCGERSRPGMSSYQHRRKLLPAPPKNDVEFFAPIGSHRASRLGGAPRHRGQKGREAMFRLIAVAFALTLASSAQAFPPAPLHQPDELVIKVREACGAGMHMVGGKCVRTQARRAASRCVRGKTC
jgi:hypothetical protein